MALKNIQKTYKFMTFIQHQKFLSTYKKYYSLYHQIPTGRSLKFFNQGKPFWSSNFLLTPSNSLDGKITKLKRKAQCLYINKRPCFLFSKTQPQPFFCTCRKYGCLIYKRSAFPLFSGGATSNSLTIQNSFAFYSYDQKWNHKFSITLQNFRILINENETQFPGGAFTILAKRQRFIRNSLKGILLVNFPEKEKNFLIKNLAAENKIALITQSASLLLKDSRNMDDLLGVDDPIQILFDKVKTCIPCLCFINNLDRIGKQRYEQEQKSLHWLNNSISLSIDQHLDRIFNTINTKQNFDFLDSTPSLLSKSYDRRSLTTNKKFSLNTKFDLNKLFNLNKTFRFNHDFKNMKMLKNLEKFQMTRFKNVQNNNQRIFKYLTPSNELDGEKIWFNQSPNKNKLQSIKPFLNLLIKLSIGSKDFMYSNAKKQLFLKGSAGKLSSKKNIPLSGKDPYFDKASFRWPRMRPCLKQAPLFFEKNKDATSFLKEKKRQIFLNTNVISPSNSLDGEITKRKNGFAGKHLLDNVSKCKASYYHRLPYWLLKNNFFFQHKINIGKVKLFKAPPGNWFYDKKKKEENVLISLKATVNPLLLQIAFCQSQSNTTNPIFAKIESNRIDPQTNLENFSTISKIPLLKNSLIKSNDTKIDKVASPKNKFKSTSKTNMYDIVLSAGMEKRNKKLSFKDLGKINTDQKHKISKIFVDSNMQSFNYKSSVFSKNFKKTNASVFNDMPVNTEFKESTSYDSLFSTKHEHDKNNLFKITETETIKRTALLKFLQILDGFHTTSVYKYKQTWLKPFSYIKNFELIHNVSPKNPGDNKNSSSKLKIYGKSFFLIKNFFTSQVLTKKLEKPDNITNIDFASFLYINKASFRWPGMHPCLQQAPLFFRNNKITTAFLKRKKRRMLLNTDAQNNIRFLETNILKKGSVRKLKPIKKSTINNMFFKPFHPLTSLYPKRRAQSQPKKNSLSYALQKKTFQDLWIASKIPKWEVYLKNQPSGKSLNLLCVWPSYIDDIMGPLNINDSASYLLPEYFQLLGHGPKLKKQGITLIASTDNLATLDAALLRPGRFDTIINFSHTLSSISKSSKILKHSPSLMQNRIFSLSVSLSINKLTSSISLLSFINVSKTIKNQFYPQVTVLDIPNQSTSIKTFIDVSVFIQYKLWWSFNNEKLSWFRLYKKSLIQKAKRPRRENDVSDFENSLGGVFKSNISVVILILKFPINKIKNVTYIFIRILRIIYFKFLGRAYGAIDFFKNLTPFHELDDEITNKENGSAGKRQLVSSVSQQDSARTDKQKTRSPLKLVLNPLKLVLNPLKLVLKGDADSKRDDQLVDQKMFSAWRENSDIYQTTEQFIMNQSSNRKEGISSINTLSREVLTSRIVNLGLSKNLSTLNYVLNPNYIFKKEAWTIPNYKNKRLRQKTINTYGNAKNFRLVPTESCNFHIKDSDMFLKYNRGLLFCNSDFDYKTYSKNNSEITLIKTNQRVQNHAKNLKFEFGVFAESIRVEKAEKKNDASFSSHMEKKLSAIAIKNVISPSHSLDGVNINNVMLTKYNEIYKLKKIKLKNGSAGKQSFFNLHPFTSFMLKRWSEVTKSNKLKQHLNISLVQTHLPWKNEIYNTNDFDSLKLLNMKANLHNDNLKYDKNHRVRGLNENNDFNKSNIKKPLNFRLYQKNKMAFSVQNSWSSNFEIMSLYNKIYHNIYSTTLFMPIPTSLLKKESLKTFGTNSLSTYESYLFKKLRTNFSLNIIGLQIDSTLTPLLKQFLEGEITNLTKGINNEAFKDLQMSRSLPNKDLFPETENESVFTTSTPILYLPEIEARPTFTPAGKKAGAFKYSRADNSKASLTYKNKISNIHLLEKENLLKKIPRRNLINPTYNNFQAKCKFKYLKKNESKMNNNIILLKNLASNKKKEHNSIKTYESFFQKAPPGNSSALFNKFNGGLPEMCRLDTSFFIFIFYTMFFEKIQNKKITLNTIKIFMPYRSLVFSHFLLSKASTYGFSCKNFEILIYNKFKNFLDL